MAIMLDADVIIQGERGILDLRRWFAAHSNERFEVAAITIAELWHGMERATGTHKAKRQSYLENILEGLPVIPYTETTALKHARLWAALEATGQSIGGYDLIVAASALERGSSLATFNQRHFAQVPGLQLIQPG